MELLWAIPALCAGVYYLIALAAGLARLRVSPPESGYAPPVSILKPVRGRDPRFYEAIRSHAEQIYPEFEILFGVADPEDPAVDDIRRLMADFPSVPIRLIHSTSRAPNGKVAVLADLAREARHPLILVNDSDILVEPGYLAAVAAPLADPSIGLVTCLYRAAATTMPGKWEAVGVATEFAPSVLVAPLVGVSSFALGSTMVLRAADLARIGGFQALAEYIADDYHLGRLISETGLRVHLSPVIVETNLSGGSWGEVWRHQLRWSRTIRVSRTAGYYGYLITHATFWSLVALAGDQWAAAAFALGARLTAGAVVSGPVLRDAAALRRWFWMPARDLWGFAIWLAGLAGENVEWRGVRIRLSPDGRILPR